MAKSKLWSEVNRTLNELNNTYNEVDQRLKCLMPIDGALKDRLEHQYFAFSNAVGSMSTHLENLKRREEEPTVADRLRNLKNVFKDRNQLKDQRKAIRQYFTNLDPTIKALKADTMIAVNSVDTHNILVENRAAQPQAGRHA
jgi:hypothetical protein